MTLRWVSSYGTLDLDGSQGVKVLRNVEGLDSPPRVLTVDQRVVGDGGVVVADRRAPRTFALDLMIDLATVGAEEVVRVLQSGTLVSTISNRSLTFVEYVSGLEGVWSAAGGTDALGWRKFPGVTFTALDPWWLDAGWQHVLPIGTPTDFNAAIPFNASIPFNGGTTTLVQILGDAPSAPIVEITGPVTELTVGTKDAVWELAQPLGAGERMLVRHTPTGSFYSSSAGKVGPMRVGGQIDWSLLTGRSRLWTMQRGLTTLLVQGTGTDENSLVRILYHQRFAGHRSGNEPPPPGSGEFTLTEDPPGSGLYVFTGDVEVIT